VEPIRHANPLIDFYEGYAIDVDLERQIVRCRSGQREGYPLPGCDDFDLPYDTLVVSAFVQLAFLSLLYLAICHHFSSIANALLFVIACKLLSPTSNDLHLTCFG
jgi:hypothetical protein